MSEFNCDKLCYAASSNNSAEKAGNTPFRKLMRHSKHEFLNKNINYLHYTLKVNKMFNNIAKNIIKPNFLFNKAYNFNEINASSESVLSQNNRSPVFSNVDSSIIDNIFKMSSQGFGVYLAASNTLLYANDAYFNLFYPNCKNKSEYIGKSIYEIIPCIKNTPLEEAWNRTISKRTANRVDEFESTPSSYLNIELIPLGERCILMSAVDITNKVLEIQKVKNISSIQNDFFSYICHEFRTPLTNIISTIQLTELICKNEMTMKLKKYIGMVKRNSYQQLRLVNNLLDITRAEAGYLRVYKKNIDIVFFTKSIIDSIEAFASIKKIKLNFSSSINSKIISLDDEKYERILLNLLSNAIKFTSEGKNIYVNIHCSDNKIYVEVKDEGPGIPEDKRKVIFERFGQCNTKLTRESEGTGLGLCLVKKFVEAMNGSIVLHSTEGIGSSFIISLKDEKLSEDSCSGNELVDSRLIQSLNMEFSNMNFDK